MEYTYIYIYILLFLEGMNIRLSRIDLQFCFVTSRVTNQWALAVSRGPGWFRKLQQACWNEFNLSWHISDSMVPRFSSGSWVHPGDDVDDDADVDDDDVDDDVDDVGDDVDDDADEDDDDDDDDDEGEEER
jgi:hypothetical protein